MATKPINRDYFNPLNPVAIYYGPILTMYRTVRAEDLKGMLDRGIKFFLVSVLEKEEFEREHIKGSINIPTGEMEKNAPSLMDRKALVVVYSAGPSSARSAVGADKLVTLGYKNVLRFEGGLEEWKKAGFETEGRAS